MPSGKNEKLKSAESSNPHEYQEYTLEMLQADTDFPRNQLSQLVESLQDPQFEAIWGLQEQLDAKIYLTGGIVRDALMGVEPKDFDFIVHFPTEVENAREQFENFFGKKKYTDPEQNEWVITNDKYGKLVLKGEGFGVYKLYPPDGTEPIDLAFPRTEHAIVGSAGGAKDFEVQSNPYLDVSEDVSRRDFTVNALLLEVSRNDQQKLDVRLVDYVKVLRISRPVGSGRWEVLTTGSMKT